ncbi:hypothetical protein [Microbacterium gallinarum]|jgi:hypothetical protein|uniref:Uncharacterized protein n=1 Tax=Microbacterium gallinarum TaxID=2762209 RepID=A0ABR8X2M2_9MICO|nr:hypothetical protein [Microbacterium gallinarum]MBD8023499.1 hypothetical protein [Microbacterium gallinarum]
MTDASLPPDEPGPEPDTTDAAEADDIDDELDAEDAPAMIEEDRVEETPA